MSAHSLQASQSLPPPSVRIPMYVVRCCTPQVRPHTVVWVTMTRCLRHPARAHKSPCSATGHHSPNKKENHNLPHTCPHRDVCANTSAARARLQSGGHPKPHPMGALVAPGLKLDQRNAKRGAPRCRRLGMAKGTWLGNSGFPDSGINCNAYQSCPTMSGSFTKQLSACRNA